MPLAWSAIACRAAQWAGRQGIDLRTAIVLVSNAQQLSPARRAWVQSGGWQPRIETTHTLAAALGPPPKAQDGQLTLDGGTDRLIAARMLRSQSWARKDPLAFDEAVAAVVATAHSLLKAAANVAPSERATHWQRAREVLGQGGTGPGASERVLAQLALEWAAQAPPRLTDRLFSLRPSAWIVVQAGGEDALTLALLQGVPSLVLDCDEPVRGSLSSELMLAVCDGFEHEAECAATQVVAALRRGDSPIALVAQDRVLVRRVRALLERQRVSLVDETGWKLSTTRAAALVMGLLRAASPDAASDLLLDWLKSDAQGGAAAGLLELEAACRRAGWRRVAEIDVARLGPAAAGVYTRVLGVLYPLSGDRRQSLSSWLAGLRTALQADGVWERLAADEAGSQVLRTLRLTESAWANQQAAQTVMSLDDFIAWVDGVLEDEAFIPAPPPDPVSVVIAPLTRLALRPFAAIVFPGADDRHLGAGPSPHPLLTDMQAAALGVPTAAQRRDAEALAFAHAVSGPPVYLFHRRSDGADPLAASPLVERLGLRLQRTGRGFEKWVDVRESKAIAPAPVAMPAPSGASLLPARLSASACEALRACPYRFYALHLLKLREADELEAELEHRDYGTWLHAVLMAFHEQRGQPDIAQVEVERLLEVAREQAGAHGFEAAEFLPYMAAFSELAPRYIAWVHERDREGTQWAQGEIERQSAPPEWHGIALFGRIDRIDRLRGGVTELLDYKTGSAQALKEKVKQPYEDTQLAFYAALVAAESTASRQAAYLSLGREIETIEHPNVDESARALVAGMAGELERIRSGAGLPALGEGQVCEFCEARGLCRRDHWAETP